MQLHHGSCIGQSSTQNANLRWTNWQDLGQSQESAMAGSGEFNAGSSAFVTGGSTRLERKQQRF